MKNTAKTFKKKLITNKPLKKYWKIHHKNQKIKPSRRRCPTW